MTQIERDVLRAFRRLVKAQGYPPSYEELGEALGLSRNQAHDAVRRLVARGRLKSDGGHRALSVVGDPLVYLSDVRRAPGIYGIQLNREDRP